MKKYAMVAINRKEEDDGVHVRRILISYLFKTKNKTGIVTYHGTKFIIADPYFSKKDASHKYIFKNRYYKLKPVEDESGIGFLYALKPDIYKKRKYHSIPGYEREFKAPYKSAAVHKFKVRKELR